MAKDKKKYVCSNCGAQSATWLGKCPVCGQWNTYEEIVSKKIGNKNISKDTTKKPVTLLEIAPLPDKRTDTKINEFNRVLGGGIIPGSLILLGGEPGIGKSTLALQVALKSNTSVLYVSGEESLKQIKLRADRLNYTNDKCLFLTETNIENILQTTIKYKPELVIIDSIQTVYTETIDSTPGSISQIRECTAQIQRTAKETNISFIIIGHITKEGNIAGPKILEHIVDTVLQFEGDKNFIYRIVRSIKNRFGSTSEIGLFEMKQSGLLEVRNPSEFLIFNKDKNISGTCIAATVEGIRPLMVEIQALVSNAIYGTPQRSSTTFDIRRLNMLLAVLEKRAGFKVSTKDVFLNIAGGLKIYDTAIDLAVTLAILSSFLDLPIKPEYTFAGELGLSSEIRPVAKIEQRINEAEKLGFKKIFISAQTKNISRLDFKIDIVKVEKIADVIKLIFKT